LTVKETNMNQAAAPISQSDDIVAIRGLRKSYSTLEVLKGIDISVKRGEVVVILGPSGSGKIHNVALCEFP
jgi:polar amino acid transport system ATP-binding protein